MLKRLSNLPSIIYVFLIPLGIAALIGGIILLFTLVATVEGVASFIFILIGLLIALASSSPKKVKGVKNVSSGFAVAMGIVFFALMGMSLDQTGNVIYNYPLQVINCPTGTYLTREAVVSNPLPGRTDINQDFNCVDSSKKVVSSIGMESVLLVRFVEYVILGYFFRFLGFVISYIQRKWAVADNQSI